MEGEEEDEAGSSIEVYSRQHLIDMRTLCFIRDGKLFVCHQIDLHVILKLHIPMLLILMSTFKQVCIVYACKLHRSNNQIKSLRRLLLALRPSNLSIKVNETKLP